MPGLVLEVGVSAGAQVAKGDALAILEAMKMQHQLRAPFDGKVLAVHISKGSQIAAGDVMIELEEES